MYLGDTKETCYLELRRPDRMAVASLMIERPVKVLDLTFIRENEMLSVLAYSALSCHQQSPADKKYRHYRFNQLFASWAKELGFDAIKCFSVQRPKHFNIVLLNPSELWPFVRILSKEEYKFDKNNRNFKSWEA